MNEYIVQPGDTIYSIARKHGMTTRQLVSVNPGITERALVIGERIQLPPFPQGRPSIETNGYVYPSADETYLREVLPYLTYLSIVGNRITLPGRLVGVNNMQMIETARQFKVAPIMVVSNTSESGLYSSALVHTVLGNPATRQRLISEIVAAVNENNYYGANIDFEFVTPENFSAYISFIQELQDMLHAQNHQLFIVIRIATILSEESTLAQLLSPAEYETLADRFLIRTNEWACNVNLEVPVLDLAQQAMDFATELVPEWKLIIGVPNCCFYSQPLIQPQTPPALLTIVEAERIATQVGASFQMDSRTGTMYFSYTDNMGNETIVWCANRCTSQSILELVRIYGLGGVSFRMIDDFPITDYQSLNAMFNIRKVM